MAKTQEILDVLGVSFIASEAIAAGSFVKIDAAENNQILKLAADTDIILGYTEFTAKINDRVTVKTGCFAKRTMSAAGTITRGTYVAWSGSTTDDVIIVKAAAAGDVVIGLATISATVGTDVEVMVYSTPVTI